MRLVPMVLMGATGFSIKKFLIFNVLSIFIWMSVYLYLGYIFGKLAETMFGKAKEYYFAFVIVLLIIFFVGLFVYKIYEKRRATT